MSMTCVYVVIIQCFFGFGIDQVFAVQYAYEGWCDQNFSMFTEYSGDADGYKFLLFDKATHGEKPVTWDSENIMLEVSKDLKFCHLFRGTRNDMDGNRVSVLRVFLKSQQPAFRLLVTNGHSHTLGSLVYSNSSCWDSFPVRFNYPELKVEPIKICVEFKAIPEGANFLAFVDHITMNNNDSIKTFPSSLGPSTVEALSSTTPRTIGLTVQSATMFMRFAVTLLLFSIVYALVLAAFICV